MSLRPRDAREAVDTIMKQTGQGPEAARLVMGEIDAESTRLNNVAHAASEVSKLLDTMPQVKDRVLAALSRDWGVSLSEPDKLFAAFGGSVENVLTRVRYIIGAVNYAHEAEMAKESAEIRRKRMESGDDRIFNMRVIGERIVGTTDGATEQELVGYGPILRAFYELCFDAGVRIGPGLKPVFRCGLKAYMDLMGTVDPGWLHGDPELDSEENRELFGEGYFEIDLPKEPTQVGKRGKKA